MCSIRHVNVSDGKYWQGSKQCRYEGAGRIYNGMLNVRIY